MFTAGNVLSFDLLGMNIVDLSSSSFVLLQMYAQNRRMLFSEMPVSVIGILAVIKLLLRCLQRHLKQLLKW